MLSRLMSPSDVQNAQSIIKEFDDTVTISDTMEPDTILRIVAPSELMLENHLSQTVFSISLRCLMQMKIKNINPLTFRHRHNLMNLFLLDKTVSIVFLDDESTDRLTDMIEKMGGTVRRDDMVNFIISPKSMEVETDAAVVQPCWLDSLFISDHYIPHTKYTYSTPISLSQEPAKKQTKAKQQISLSFSQKQKPQRQIKQHTRSPRLNIVTEGKKGKTINKMAPPRSNSRVDDFFNRVNPPKAVSSDKHMHVEERLPGELLLVREASTTTSPRQKDQHEEEFITEFFCEKTEAEKPRKSELQRPGGLENWDGCDTDISDISDENEAKPESNDRSLESLCQTLMKTRSEPKTKEKEKTGTHNGQLDQLMQFSQAEKESESEECVFDVEYEKPMTMQTNAQIEEDPLFNMFDGPNANKT